MLTLPKKDTQTFGLCKNRGSVCSGDVVQSHRNQPKLSTTLRGNFTLRLRSITAYVNLKTVLNWIFTLKIDCFLL
jgi:hypothetical protein